MDLILVAIRSSGTSKTPLADAAAEYVTRCSRYFPTRSLLLRCKDEAFALRSKPASHMWLLDSRGKQVSSEEFAASIGKLRDGGKRTLILAIGPADGWTDEDRQRADGLISLGKMTLPHELAALVLAEQVYRACTILASHPYHCGH